MFGKVQRNGKVSHRPSCMLPLRPAIYSLRYVRCKLTETRTRQATHCCRITFTLPTQTRTRIARKSSADW